MIIMEDRQRALLLYYKKTLILRNRQCNFIDQEGETSSSHAHHNQGVCLTVSDTQLATVTEIMLKTHKPCAVQCTGGHKHQCHLPAVL
jgi:hypothetical protein